MNEQMNECRHYSHSKTNKFNADVVTSVAWLGLVLCLLS
jgi:hypothetical protein